MNKKVIYIGVGAAVLAATAFLLYRKYRRPSIEEVQVDWTNEFASFFVNGKQIDVVKNMGTMIGNGYSLEWNRSAGEGTDITGIVLKKDGSILEYVSTR